MCIFTSQPKSKPHTKHFFLGTINQFRDTLLCLQRQHDDNARIYSHLLTSNNNNRN